MKTSSFLNEGAHEGAPFIFWDSFGARNDQSGIGVYRENLLSNMSIEGRFLGSKSYNGRFFSPNTAEKLRLPWFCTIADMVNKWSSSKKVLHGLCNYNYYPGLAADVHSVLTVHDVIPLVESVSLSSRFWYKALFLKALHRANAVVSISQATQQEIFRLFPEFEQESKFSIIPNGCDHIGRTSVTQRAMLDSSRKKALFISRYEHYKGFSLLADVINNSSDVFFEVVTCFRGKIFLDRAISRKARESVSIRTEVSQKEIKNLLDHASVFLHFSSREGFGLPFEEACYSLLPIIYAPCDALEKRTDPRFHIKLPKDEMLASCLDTLENRDFRAIDLKEYDSYLDGKSTWQDSATLYQKLYNEL